MPHYERQVHCSCIYALHIAPYKLPGIMLDLFRPCGGLQCVLIRYVCKCCRALGEFRRVLKPDGLAMMSGECLLLSLSSFQTYMRL